MSAPAAAFARARIGGRYEIVPNGTDVSRFADAAAADLGPGRKLLFVGRLDLRKGFPVALAAFARLGASREDLRLIVVGDGPERSAVEGLPAGIRTRVEMLGAVANEALPTYHAACDVYVGPALGGESFGMVLVEAMAAGLPVVASAIEGYREVVRDGVDGLLVPPRDPVALSDAVARILDDEVLAARLRAAGRAPWLDLRLDERGAQARGALRARRRTGAFVATIGAVAGLWILVAIVVVLVLMFVFGYNRLVRERQRVENGWSQIDVQLRRRYDLIPNLVETVKGYAAHERELFEDVAQARSDRDGCQGRRGAGAGREPGDRRDSASSSRWRRTTRTSRRARTSSRCKRS